MSAPVRVLIADESIVVRRLVAEALAASPQIEVVGKAANGRIARRKVEHLDPEVVLMAFGMYEDHGAEAFQPTGKSPRSLKVVLLSEPFETEEERIVQALARGADDWWTKPEVPASAESQTRFRDGLLPKLFALVPRMLSVPVASSIPQAPRRLPLRNARTRVDALVIASSTGGPNALAEVVPQLAGDLPVPVLIVQHMPASFTPHLAARLNTLSPLPVHEGRDGMPVEDGHVYLAPGGLHMSLRRVNAQSEQRVVAIHDGPPEHSCRPAADVLFRSAVEQYGRHTLGVVLTGMGKDGLAGCRKIRGAGGQVISQDEGSSVVWGMPGWVAKEGVTDCVLPLTEIAAEVERRLWYRRVRSHRGQRRKGSA